ncbi:carboxylesterase family protein [Streptomyces rugosispiralis]|uniref:carboxylesterase family protein n=1 Tax=Streptomyces rugosispiralis TaxID=2967341 RepID=UPI003703C754
MERDRNVGDEGVVETMTNPTARVVATDRGEVRGCDEGAVVSFRGVPYAASPVGASRFAAPRPHPGWTGVRAAVRPGPAVPQAPSRLERVTESASPAARAGGTGTTEPAWRKRATWW